MFSCEYWTTLVQKCCVIEDQGFLKLSLTGNLTTTQSTYIQKIHIGLPLSNYLTIR